MIYFEADDGRVCLVYGYFGLALVGSTDIPADDPDNVRCDDDEVGYLIESLSALFPGLHFDRSQIVYAYSGIRPLPTSDASVPGLISRDHSSPTIEPEGARPFPIVSLVGGKWTTFRGFAEEVADNLLARLGRPRRVSTAELPIGGGRNYPAEDSEARRLARRNICSNRGGACAACRSPGPLRNDSALDIAAYRRFHRRAAARPRAGLQSRRN